MRALFIATLTLRCMHCTCIQPAEQFACVNGRCEGLNPDGGLWP